jgi:excisionase family DNA binding protein
MNSLPCNRQYPYKTNTQQHKHNKHNITEVATEVKLFTVKKVAEICDVRRDLVYELIRKRELPCVRVGNAIRVREEDLEAYLTRVVPSQRYTAKQLHEMWTPDLMRVAEAWGVCAECMAADARTADPEQCRPEQPPRDCVVAAILEVMGEEAGDRNR